MCWCELTSHLYHQTEDGQRRNSRCQELHPRVGGWVGQEVDGHPEGRSASFVPERGSCESECFNQNMRESCCWILLLFLSWRPLVSSRQWPLCHLNPWLKLALASSPSFPLHFLVSHISGRCCSSSSRPQTSVRSSVCVVNQSNDGLFFNRSLTSQNVCFTVHSYLIWLQLFFPSQCFTFQRRSHQSLNHRKRLSRGHPTQTGNVRDVCVTGGRYLGSLSSGLSDTNPPHRIRALWWPWRVEGNRHGQIRSRHSFDSTPLFWLIWSFLNQILSWSSWDDRKSYRHHRSGTVTGEHVTGLALRHASVTITWSYGSSSGWWEVEPTGYWRSCDET